MSGLPETDVTCGGTSLPDDYSEHLAIFYTSLFQRLCLVRHGLTVQIDSL